MAAVSQRLHAATLQDFRFRHEPTDQLLLQLVDSGGAQCQSGSEDIRGQTVSKEVRGQTGSEDVRGQTGSEVVRGHKEEQCVTSDLVAAA